MATKEKRYRKGETVICNIGRARGMRCKIVGVEIQAAPGPDGSDRDVVWYDVQTPNGNVVRRGADKLAPFKAEG